VADHWNGSVCPGRDRRAEPVILAGRTPFGRRRGAYRRRGRTALDRRLPRSNVLDITIGLNQCGADLNKTGRVPLSWKTNSRVKEGSVVPSGRARALPDGATVAPPFGVLPPAYTLLDASRCCAAARSACAFSSSPLAA
jgi:hypothetical protein